MVRRPPSCPRLALLGCAFLAACSRAPDASAPLPPVAAVVKGRLRQFSGFEAELLASTTPRPGVWKLEHAAAAIESKLRATLLSFLSGTSKAEEAARALCGTRFAGATELVAATRASVFDDGTLRVEEPAGSLGSALAPPAEFAAQLERWRASFAGWRLERLEIGVDGLEALGEGKLRATLALCLVARQGPQGLQQNLRWGADWDLAPGGAPRLAELRLESFQEVRAAGPLFRELTRELCEPLACWREELLRGTIDYHLRQDRLSRQPWMGMHGIAVGDANGDGLEDIYLAQPGGQPNRLLLKQKDGSLLDGSEAAGVDVLDNTGPVLFADLDGDGDQDLLLGLIGSVQLLWNDGAGHFGERQALPQPDKDAAECFSMGAADVDCDGDLDLFAARYITGGIGGGTPVPYHDAENGARNLFWRNEGGRRFTEALEQVGLGAHARRFSLAVLFEDFDEDGWIDLLVVNDFGRSCLYKNERGRFRDVAPERGLDGLGAGMGADIADYDGDGLQDLYLTDMSSEAGARLARNPEFMPGHPELRPAYQRHAAGNTLLRGRADGSFEEAGAECGAKRGGWAWGARFVDWSNSGWPDIFVPNGFQSNVRLDDLEPFFWREVIARSPAAPPTVEAYEKSYGVLLHLSTFEGWSWSGWEPKYAYLNLRQGRFAEVAGAAQLDYLDDSRAAATVDWDDDGRLDILLRNRTGPRLRLLLGAQRTQNHFLELALRSNGPNRDAIGAVVRVEAGGRHWRESVQSSQGFLCASSRRLHFGLGEAARVERIEVRWPDGQLEAFRDVAVDARYRLLQGAGALERREREPCAALDGLAGSRVDVAPRPQSRIALYDELPVGPLELPSFAGKARRVSEFAGKPLLVTVGSWSDARSRAWFERLASAGCEQRFVLLDEGARLDAARAGIVRLGLEPRAGAATQAFRGALEVFLVEILGPFQQLDQPLALLIDGTGRLVAVHSAPAELADVLADLRDPEHVLPGRWIQRPRRSFEKIADVLRKIGQPELADLYAERARR